MKKNKVRILSGVLLGGLIMMNLNSYAGLGAKFNQYIGSEFTNINGFYIILGVIGVGIIGKAYQHFFLKEDTKPITKVKISQHSHQRLQRSRLLIKKTS